LNKIVSFEIDRQAWRGDMYSKSCDYYLADKRGAPNVKDMNDQGTEQPLPPVKRDNAFKQGGWIASSAQQRRASALDGGTFVTKLRLKVGSTSS